MNIRVVITLDPSGELYGLPTYPWRCAPDGLATRRQLAERGLRPAGQAPAAQVMRRRHGKAGVRRGPLVAYLYRVDLAATKRPVTPAMRAALAAALRARQTCGSCTRHVGYVPPAYTGRRCWDCAGLAG
jgi:hypothetical protein